MDGDEASLHTPPRFGQRVTVSIPRFGDLIGRVYLGVTLPHVRTGTLDEYFDAIVSGGKQRPAPLWVPQFLREAVDADRSTASMLARLYPSAVAFVRLAEYVVDQLQHQSRTSRELRRAARNHFASYYVSPGFALTDADYAQWVQAVASDTGRDPPCSFLELCQPHGGGGCLARVCSRPCGASTQNPSARPLCRKHTHYCQRLVCLLERRVSRNVAASIVCAYV